MSVLSCLGTCTQGITAGPFPNVLTLPLLPKLTTTHNLTDVSSAYLCLILSQARQILSPNLTRLVENGSTVLDACITWPRYLTTSTSLWCHGNVYGTYCLHGNQSGIKCIFLDHNPLVRRHIPQVAN